MADHSDASPLIAPSPITEPNEIDLEAGPGEQIQCRICLETDGIYLVSKFFSIILLKLGYTLCISFSKFVAWLENLSLSKRPRKTAH